MATKKMPFKSYCWSIGTTSYRTGKFNLSIEKQLYLMDKFKKLPQNNTQSWRKLQTDYYYFLKENDFVKGDAGRPDKDAREKTSGLVDIGLIDSERNLTETGQVLLQLSLDNNFQSDNKLEIASDSYIYLKQMLKTSNNVNGKTVRPFIVFLYVVSKLGYLTNDEFTYLLPLCIDEDTTLKIVEHIKDYRLGEITFDDILMTIMLSMDNYKVAYSELCNNKITEELFCTIGLNRKSKTYDKSYFLFYKLLKKVALNKDKRSVLPLFEATKNLSNNPAKLWRKYLFNITSLMTIKRKTLEVLNDNQLINAKNIKEFNKVFFEQMHLFKIKSTLNDYFDLNRRYFKITDVVLFNDEKVELDVLPKCFFNNISNELIKIAFEESKNLRENIAIENIDPCLIIDEKKLFAELGRVVGVKITTGEVARKIVKDERYARFNRLVDEKFSKANLIDLFTKFENRADNEIRRIITDNADIPTMFEYVLGIAWYVISEKQGDILEYMNLSLEADLLPKTHAIGGNADIEYLYPQSAHYPAHILLIEATLSEKAGQRRMEMEPVSRHVGDYMLANPKIQTYCVFVSTYLNLNVISDFRGRKTAEYFNQEGTQFVNGMKILPVQTSEIKTILETDIKYRELYLLFEKAYNSTETVAQWYEKEIVEACNRGDIK